MKIELTDKVVVITGASKGIGSELARVLVKEGATVVINYNKSADRANELLNEIREYNADCIAVKADITDAKEVSEFYHTVYRRFGKIDILINNAGVCNDNLIQMMTIKQWNEVVNTNLFGTFLCCREFSKAMIENKKGKIINIASLKGQQGCEGQVNYSASKGGVISMTKTLAKELGIYNIAVNALCPGFIVTDLNRHNEEKKEKARRVTAMKSSMDSLRDLVNFVIYICSDYFEGVSGQVFNLDSRIL